MTFSPSSVSASLAAILIRHGLRVDIDKSGLSSSQYLTVDHYDETTDDYIGPEIKVRIATHAARPTYERLNGAADIEVGTHCMACTQNASDAAAWVLQRYAMEPDKRLASVLARQATKAEAARQARATHDAECAARNAAAAEDIAKLDAILVERGYVRADLGGKKWREKRAALRRQMEA